MTNADKNRRMVITFFAGMLIGFLRSAWITDLKGLSAVEVVRNLFFVYWYNIIIGIGTGIAAMFTSFLYEILKKRNGKLLNNNLCFT